MDPDYRTLEKVAHHLTGKPVFVRRQAPAIKSAVGQASRNDGGAYFIDLDPKLTGRALLKVYLHECGHVCRGHCERGSYIAHARSQSVPLAVVASDRAYPAREDEADRLTRVWLDWLDAHGGDVRQLLRWWPPEIQTIIDKAVGAALKARTR